MLEGFVIATAIGLFAGYHVWFFVWRKVVERRGGDTAFQGINGKGRLARVVFTEVVSTDSKAAVLGIQQSRCVHSLLDVW